MTGVSETGCLCWSPEGSTDNCTDTRLLFLSWLPEGDTVRRLYARLLFLRLQDPHVGVAVWRRGGLGAQQVPARAPTLPPARRAPPALPRLPAARPAGRHAPLQLREEAWLRVERGVWRGGGGVRGPLGGRRWGRGVVARPTAHVALAVEVTQARHRAVAPHELGEALAVAPRRPRRRRCARPVGRDVVVQPRHQAALLAWPLPVFARDAVLTRVVEARVAGVARRRRRRLRATERRRPPGGALSPVTAAADEWHVSAVAVGGGVRLASRERPSPPGAHVRPPEAVDRDDRQAERDRCERVRPAGGLGRPTAGARRKRPRLSARRTDARQCTQRDESGRRARLRTRAVHGIKAACIVHRRARSRSADHADVALGRARTAAAVTARRTRSRVADRAAVGARRWSRPSGHVVAARRGRRRAGVAVRRERPAQDAHEEAETEQEDGADDDEDGAREVEGVGARAGDEETPETGRGRLGATGERPGATEDA